MTAAAAAAAAAALACAVAAAELLLLFEVDAPPLLLLLLPPRLPGNLPCENICMAAKSGGNPPLRLSDSISLRRSFSALSYVSFWPDADDAEPCDLLPPPPLLMPEVPACEPRLLPLPAAWLISSPVTRLSDSSRCGSLALPPSRLCSWAVSLRLSCALELRLRDELLPLVPAPPDEPPPLLPPRDLLCPLRLLLLLADVVAGLVLLVPVRLADERPPFSSEYWAS